MWSPPHGTGSARVAADRTSKSDRVLGRARAATWYCGRNLASGADLDHGGCAGARYGYASTLSTVTWYSDQAWRAAMTLITAGVQIIPGGARVAERRYAVRAAAVEQEICWYFTPPGGNVLNSAATASIFRRSATFRAAAQHAQSDKAKVVLGTSHSWFSPCV